jgi:glucose-1-phosphate cytidylyltransferase
VKVIILAGGFGTRISEETENKPKPMVLLDDKPIIWHLMEVYARQGFNDFVIATGYKSEVIHEWVDELNTDWKIQAINTGLATQTAGRIQQITERFNEPQFMITYGDGLGNVNVKNLLVHHNREGRTATVTAVRPPSRFGVIQSEDNLVTHFGEKNQVDAGWINGGFFVVEKRIERYIDSHSESFEANVLPKLVGEQELTSFHHDGFWQPMDTLREKNELSIFAKDPKSYWLKDL